MFDLYKLISIILLFIPIKAFGYDYSTPNNGNLTIDVINPFFPNNVTTYSDYTILKQKGFSYKFNRIYRFNETPETVELASRTINSDITWIDNETYVILTGNSESYPHGILGDIIESNGFHIYRKDRLLVKYQLPKDRVFETLRPLIADLIPEHDGVEIILTSSDKRSGSRVDAFSLKGELLTSSKPIGQGFRWLHIIGVMSLGKSNTPYLSVVKTPHIGGVLELLYWNGNELTIEASLDNISTHKIGSDNLNMALQLSSLEPHKSLIIVPTMDFKTILFISLVNKRLKIVKRIELPGILSTNLFFELSETPSIWLGLTNGKIVNIN